MTTRLPIGLTTIEISMLNHTAGSKSPKSRYAIKYVFRNGYGDVVSPVFDLGPYAEAMTVPEALNLVAVELRTRETVFHQPHQD